MHVYSCRRRKDFLIIMCPPKIAQLSFWMFSKQCHFLLYFNPMQHKLEYLKKYSIVRDYLSFEANFCQYYYFLLLNFQRALYKITFSWINIHSFITLLCSLDLMILILPWCWFLMYGFWSTSKNKHNYIINTKVLMAYEVIRV